MLVCGGYIGDLHKDVAQTLVARSEATATTAALWPVLPTKCAHNLQRIPVHLRLLWHCRAVTFGGKQRSTRWYEQEAGEHEWLLGRRTWWRCVYLRCHEPRKLRLHRGRGARSALVQTTISERECAPSALPIARATQGVATCLVGGGRRSQIVEGSCQRGG